MRPRLLLGFFLLTLISVVAAACQRQRASAVAHQPTAVDSGRGIVSVVGTMFEQRLMLSADSGITGHPFRFNSATHSGRMRPARPGHFGQRLHA